MNIDRLYHLWTEPEGDFFARIDSLGGWPVGKQFVILQHTVETERPCYFSDTPLRNEWNTVICSADDYYWWKLSAEAKAKYRLALRREFAQEIQRQA